MAVGDGETKIAMDEYGLEYDQYAEGMSSCIKLRITKKDFVKTRLFQDIKRTMKRFFFSGRKEKYS